jgi:hypothetical protein
LPGLDDDQQQAFVKVFGTPKALKRLVPEWAPKSNRCKVYKQIRKSSRRLHKIFRHKSKKAAEAAGIFFGKDGPEGIYRDSEGIPTLEVHSVRPSRRIGPDGQTVTELVVEMTQRRRGYLDKKIQKEVDEGKRENEPPDFIFRSGCTLLIDLESGSVKYVISKGLLDEKRLEKVRRYLDFDGSYPIREMYFGDPRGEYFKSLIESEKDEKRTQHFEPFAILHRSTPTEEEEL